MFLAAITGTRLDALAQTKRSILLARSLAFGFGLTAVFVLLGLGFGLIPINPADQAAGKYFTWSGYAGTNMWVDPVNDITTIFMMQNNEASPDFRPLHGQWVYGGYKPAVTSGPAMPPAQ
jgi:CubicO group peptidase (beta-lactamase class C family)